MASQKIEDRKLRDRRARRAQIVGAARRIAEKEGWPNVTVRRLSDEISYSQPVLYSHFENRESIVAEAAIEGFQELALALQHARSQRGNPIEQVAKTYMDFAATSPALYDAMFSLSLNVLFDNTATPTPLRAAFSQVRELFHGEVSRSDGLAETFWASLHGIADLTRTKRLPPKRQKERVKIVVELFSSLTA